MATGAVSFQWLVAEPAFRTAAVQGSASAEAYRRALEIIVLVGLASAVGSGAVWLVALATRIGGEPAVVLTATGFGHVWIARLVLAVLMAGFVLLNRQRTDGTGWKHALAVIGAASLMGSLAWSGHAAGTPGVPGEIHRAADVLHLVACAAWLGGLLPLWLLLRNGLRNTEQSLAFGIVTATRRFSALGVAAVGTLLVSGLVNAWMLAGDPQALLDTRYGQLLVLKVVLFLFMVALAACNRGRLVPELLHAGAMRRLAGNSLVEVGVGLVILAIVGALGVLPPASHMAMPMH